MQEATQSSKRDVATAAFGKVLGEAMEEINCLEQKNSKMQDVLNELQEGILNLNMSVSSINVPDSENIDNRNDLLEQVSLPDQIKDFKRISSDIVSKLNIMIQGNFRDGLLQDAFESGLCEVKKKLSSLSIAVQQFSQDTVRKSDFVSSAPSICISDENNTRGLNSSSVLDSSLDNLQYQLRDALDKNVRWQNYNQEREQYVRLLLSKYNQNCTELKQLREKITEITSQPDMLATEQRRHFDKLLVGARQELESQRSQNLQIQTELNVLTKKYKEETKQLEVNVEHWRKRYEEQREALAAMNANYENEKRRSSNSVNESKEKQSQIQLLQRQVQLFSEDFRAERKEKEAAQSEIDFLKLKVNQLQRDIDRQKKPPVVLKSDSISDHVKTNNDYNNKNSRKPSKPMSNIANVISSTPFDKFSHLNNPSITTRKSSPTPKPRYRKPERKNKPPDIPHRPKITRDNTEFGKVSDTEPRKLSYTSTSKRLSEADSILCCPSCDMQYSIDEHLLLLAHIDTCGD